MNKLLFLLALFALPSFASPEDDVRTIAVGTIDILDLDFDPAPNPTVGNKYVLEVQPGNNPRQFKAIPIKKGSTSLILSDQQGKIRRKLIYNIITNDLSNRALTLRKLLAPVHGVRVETVDDKVVIEGDVAEPKHADRIAKLVKAFPEVLDLTSTADSACAICEACGKKKK